MIWWWQFSWRDGLIPLSVTRLDWSVKMRSVQDDKFWRMCVGSDISWEKPYSELIDSICVPLLFVMSWTHQLLDLILKSPSRIVKVGSWFLILPKRFSRDKMKMFKFTLILTWRVIQGNHIPFLFSNDNFTRWTFWESYITHLPYGNLIIVINAYTSSFNITGMICFYYRLSFNGQSIVILWNWGIKGSSRFDLIRHNIGVKV